MARMTSLTPLPLLGCLLARTRVGRAALAAPLLALLGAAPALGQTEVWSATLTVRDLTAGIRGCSNSVQFGNCSNTSNLSEDEFTYDSTTYTIQVLLVRPNGELSIQLSTAITDATNTLNLAVGDQQFSLSAADLTSITGRTKYWNNSGLNWPLGTTVELKLLDPSAIAASATASSSSGSSGRKPQPLQMALWTDRQAYLAGQTVRLYRTLNPHDDRGRYRSLLYLEKAGGGERRYLAPLSATGGPYPDPVNLRGMPVQLARERTLTVADRALSFEGEAPEPGLWRFVMELRPSTEQESEPRRTRRAWASFTVAERSQLLNRRAFDREIRTDLTLRSNTIYYLGHQLFVHDGATLTIEPGTVVSGYGLNTAIIVEPGGRIVAEGTREAPVVLTCSAPVGRREAGCWGGLRILGNAPVTRLEGVAPGVLPAERPVYGGTDAEDSSGVLRYVRVEFAGAAGESEVPGPAIGLYGVGGGTVLDHVQARASLGDGFAFHGGTAPCGHCVASGSGNAGLSWERGWRGAASHLYVQLGSGGVDGLAGGNDNQGHDLEPRSLPTLSNVTLIHSVPHGNRDGVALRLSTGSGVRAGDLLATRFAGGAIDARGRSGLLFAEGESSVTSSLLYLNGVRQLRGSLRDVVEFINRDPKLRDVRDFANPDPRPKANSPALSDEAEGYIGAFGREENWLDEWTVFGPESVYDLRERDEEDD